MKKLLFLSLIICLFALTGCAETTYHNLCGGKIVELTKKGNWLNRHYRVILETKDGKSSFDVEYELYKTLEVGTTVNIRYNELGEIKRINYDMEACKNEN